MNETQKNILEEIVEYNRDLINEKGGGDMNKVLDDLIILNHNNHSIWDPFTDATSRFEVDPVDEYGAEKIENFIEKYNSQ